MQEKSLNFLVIVVLIIFLAIVILRTAWVCDDAYISFRVVDNFVNGYGLTWNIDERVQVFTNPLWVLLLSVFYSITNEIHITGILISVFLTVLAAIVIVYRIAATEAAAVLTIMALMSSKAFTDYATSGLENPLTYLLLAVFLWLFLTRELNLKAFFVMSLVASLGMVNRMDTGLLYIPALIFVFTKVPWGKALAYWFLGFLPFLMWEMFALIYYGFPFPNTYYAKLHTGIASSDLVVQGLIYCLDSLRLDPVTLLVVAVGVIVATNSRNKRALVVALGIVLYVIYVVTIGGDFMSGRFFAAPLLCAACIIAFQVVLSSRVSFWTLVVLIFVIGILSPRSPLLSDETYGLNLKRVVAPTGISDERAYYFQQTGLQRANLSSGTPRYHWYDEGLEWQRSRQKVVERYAVGYFGFAAGPDVHIVDMNALTDPLLARLPSYQAHGWRIGHFVRIIPDGYIKSLESSQNLIVDSNIANYYDKLKLLTTGKIFSTDRFIEIWNFNLGQRNHSLKHFFKNSKDVEFGMINVPKPQGTVWNDSGNVLFDQKGLNVFLDSIYHNEKIELSVDHNDSYNVVLFNGSSPLVQQGIASRAISGGGLRVDTVKFRLRDVTRGYNMIKVIPIKGDGHYSLGHIRVLESIVE